MVEIQGNPQLLLGCHGLVDAFLFRVEHITKRSDTIAKAIVSITNYLLIRLLFRVPLSDYQNVCIYPVRFLVEHPVEAKSSDAASSAQ